MGYRKKTAFSNKKKGSLFIEALVSVSILVVTLSAFAGSVITSVNALQASKVRAKAAQVAQDGMELFVSKTRNQTYCFIYDLGCADWKTGLVVSPGPSSFEIDGAIPAKLTSDTWLDNFDPNHYLCIFSSTGLEAGRVTYCADPAYYIPGNMTREIRVTDITDESIRVQVIVRWDHKGNANSLALETVLFNFLTP